MKMQIIKGRTDLPQPLGYLYNSLEVNIGQTKTMIDLFFEEMSTILTMFSIILALLLLFQWYSQHAKEQSIKNYLFSIKRMVARIEGLNSVEVMKEKARDLIDTIDATLATVGARHPFLIKVEEVLKKIRERFESEEKKDLESLPREKKDIAEEIKG